MKKIIFLCLIGALLSSCDDKILISKEEYAKLKGDTFKPEYPKPFHFKGNHSGGDFSWQVELGEDNHEYLNNIGSNAFVLIHYPDCKKCNKNKKDTI